MLLAVVTAFCQPRQTGLLVPINSVEPERCCLFLPEEGLAIYDKPRGTKTGILSRADESAPTEEARYSVFYIDMLADTSNPIESESLQEISYEILSFRFFERKKSFIRIISASADYWVSEKELKLKGFSAIDWQQFFIGFSGTLMGFYANDPGLALKVQPSDDSETKEFLQGDLFEIAARNQCKGDWTKVIVKKYREHPCETDLGDPENIEYEIEGWLKVVDDKGNPNLYYFSRGC
jgi:hypothetical protein